MKHKLKTYLDQFINFFLEDIFKSKRYVKLSFALFLKNAFQTYAAAISYYALISFFPLIFITISILGYFIGSNDVAQTQVIEYLKNFIPNPGKFFYPTINAITHTKEVVGIVGIFTLLWISSNLFLTIEYGINLLFKKKKIKENFILKRLFAIILSIIFGILFVISIIFTSFATYIIKSKLQYYYFKNFGILIDIFIYFIPLLVTTMIFLFLYYVIPKIKIYFKAVFRVSIIIALFFELEKIIFSLYLSEFSTYNKIYGILGALFGFLFWLYFTSSLLLYGATLLYYYNKIYELRDLYNKKKS